jgi:prepilin-type N-terminal cleavage/methylation domain-containing protein
MDNRGFTLIELIVVLFIIAVSSAVIFINVRANSNISNKKFISYVVRIIEKARTNSIVNDADTVIVINPEKRLIYIKGLKKDKILIPKEITITEEFIVEKEGLYYIYFFHNGSSSGADLNFYAKDFAKKILIDQVSGFVKVIDTESDIHSKIETQYSTLYG